MTEPKRDPTAGRRRAVVYYYSQTGQLCEVADALTAPLHDAGWRVRWVAVQPRTPFPFPWPLRRFFGVFPDAVDPAASVRLIEPAGGFGSDPDELVIIAYQVWFLAPSLPARSLLTAHPEAVRDRSVISLVACRNMWYSAATEVAALLRDAGARRIEAVAATDTHRSATTLVTTLRWLLTGEREPFWWFHRAGVSDDELDRVTAVGEGLARTGRVSGDAAPVVPALAVADLLAGRVFRRWAAASRAARRLGPAGYGLSLVGFACALTVGILVGLPLIALVAAAGGTRFAAAVQRFLMSRASLGSGTGPKAVPA